MRTIRLQDITPLALARRWLAARSSPSPRAPSTEEQQQAGWHLLASGSLACTKQQATSNCYRMYLCSAIYCSEALTWQYHLSAQWKLGTMSRRQQSKRRLQSNQGEEFPSGIVWSTAVVWARDGPNASELHPAFLPEQQGNDRGNGGGHTVVWIKWQATGGIVQKNSQIYRMSCPLDRVDGTVQRLQRALTQSQIKKKLKVKGVYRRRLSRVTERGASTRTEQM